MVEEPKAYKPNGNRKLAPDKHTVTKLLLRSIQQLLQLEIGGNSVITSSNYYFLTRSLDNWVKVT